MSNQITTMLMNQLKIKNPQMFNMISQAQKNKQNPMELFNQVTSGYSQEQMNNLMAQARNMGFPENILNQVQEGINTK